jgi:transposase
MIRLELTLAALEDISEALDDPENGEKQKLKLLVIRMHHQGAEHGFIAGCLRLSPNTITNYLKEYQTGGLAAILERRYYQPSSSLKAFWECIRCSFTAEPVVSGKDAIARIESLSGVRLSESQARRVMKQMGMVLRKTAPHPRQG